MLLITLLAGVITGVVVRILPPLGASPEFAAFALIVAANAIMGTTLGAQAARRLGIGAAGATAAIVCAIGGACALVAGVGHNPGAAALALGPVMAAMAYWSAMVSAHTERAAAEA